MAVKASSSQIFKENNAFASPLPLCRTARIMFETSLETLDAIRYKSPALSEIKDLSKKVKVFSKELDACANFVKHYKDKLNFNKHLYKAYMNLFQLARKIQDDKSDSKWLAIEKQNKLWNGFSNNNQGFCFKLSVPWEEFIAIVDGTKHCLSKLLTRGQYMEREFLDSKDNKEQRFLLHKFQNKIKSTARAIGRKLQDLSVMFDASNYQGLNGLLLKNYNELRSFVNKNISKLTGKGMKKEIEDYEQSLRVIESDAERTQKSFVFDSMYRSASLNQLTKVFNSLAQVFNFDLSDLNKAFKKIFTVEERSRLNIQVNSFK